jgi:hypothetical protein
VPTALRLSPDFGLSLIRLTTTVDELTELTWPGLLLHSKTLTWAFDQHGRALDSPAEVGVLARADGLHQVSTPFDSTDLPAPTQPWMFHLPTLRTQARLTRYPAPVPGLRPSDPDPDLVVEVARTPKVTDDWWGLVVTRGAHARLLVAACVQFPDDPAATDPADAAGILTEAARDGRVYGATIGVQF